MNEKIDFVVPWVDGGELEWKKEKAGYDSGVVSGNSSVRFRDWGNLEYWFRSVEKFTPWVNRIYFITWGHVPAFLTESHHEKLRVIRHEDYIPQKYLPTFNANTIELNLHRIPELSENFVYFNDDTFILRPMQKTDFFRGGLPCEEAVEEPLIPRTEEERLLINYLRLNDVTVINRHFDKREQLKKHFWKWINPVYGKALIRTFTMLYWNHYAGFKNAHLPVAMKKSTIQKVWDAEPEVMHGTCMHRFRSIEDVNQYVVRYWQVVSGEFVPQKAKGKYYALQDDIMQQVKRDIAHPHYDMICVNDAGLELDFAYCSAELREAFESLLPEKSTFEK